MAVACVCDCVYIYICVCDCVYICACVTVCIYMCVRDCVYICVRDCVYICIMCACVRDPSNYVPTWADTNVAERFHLMTSIFF